MKVLFNCIMPFSLAHGGQQIQVERTMEALLANGVEVEPLRWWDDKQTGDLIHYFGRMPFDHIDFAHQKGMKVIMADLLTNTGSRTSGQLRLQKWVKTFIKRFAPASLISQFQWRSYQTADTIIALTPWEAHLMTYMFGADPKKTLVMANGVEDVFLQSPAVERGSWLICTATITERKRVLELAQAAVAARTPLWVIGKAYNEADPYAQRFLDLARQHPDFVRYEGAIHDRQKLAGIYRAARGFVLLSTRESQSLSAEEAAGCRCPLLLSDLPWAHSTFGAGATYVSANADTAATAAALRHFYDAAPQLPLPRLPATWLEIGRQLKAIYEQTLQEKVHAETRRGSRKNLTAENT
jgi:glycosyltransferase involved in cell wall biosynthesis